LFPRNDGAFSFLGQLDPNADGEMNYRPWYPIAFQASLVRCPFLIRHCEEAEGRRGNLDDAVFKIASLSLAMTDNKNERF
jgi:hypothetical protein